MYQLFRVSAFLKPYYFILFEEASIYVVCWKGEGSSTFAFLYLQVPYVNLTNHRENTEKNCLEHVQCFFFSKS